MGNKELKRQLKTKLVYANGEKNRITVPVPKSCATVSTIPMAGNGHQWFLNPDQLNDIPRSRLFANLYPLESLNALINTQYCITNPCLLALVEDWDGVDDPLQLVRIHRYPGRPCSNEGDDDLSNLRYSSWLILAVGIGGTGSWTVKGVRDSERDLWWDVDIPIWFKTEVGCGPSLVCADLVTEDWSAVLHPLVMERFQTTKKLHRMKGRRRRRALNRRWWGRRQLERWTDMWRKKQRATN